MRPPQADGLASHLEHTYDIEVTGVRSLDLGVLKVDMDGHNPWVARVFSPDRPPSGAAGDAAILQRLARVDAHTERCAHPEPVSELDGQQVLVTDFVGDHPPVRAGRAEALLAAMLGKLHTHSGEDMRAGGAWHHLSFSGGPPAEIAAAQELVDGFVEDVPVRQLGLVDRLRAQVEATDGCDDLPHAFVHPDPVLSNAVATADANLVLVDWTGAGRGPRLWSIGFLLWAAGMRSPKLVDVVVTYYRRWMELTDAELQRLDAAIRGRPVMLETWAVCTGRRDLRDALAQIDQINAHAAAIADQARRAFRRSLRE